MKSKYIELMARRKKELRKGNEEAAAKLFEAARKLKTTQEERSASAMLG